MLFSILLASLSVWWKCESFRGQVALCCPVLTGPQGSVILQHAFVGKRTTIILKHMSKIMVTDCSVVILHLCKVLIVLQNVVQNMRKNQRILVRRLQRANKRMENCPYNVVFISQNCSIPQTVQYFSIHISLTIESRGSCDTQLF